MMMSYSDSAARSTANSVGILHFAASALRLDVTRCTSCQNDVTLRPQEVGREGGRDIADPSARSRACDSPVVPGRLAACHPERSAACVAAAPVQAWTDAPEVDAAEPLQHTLHCLWRVERLRVDKGLTNPSGWTCWHEILHSRAPIGIN